MEKTNATRRLEAGGVSHRVTVYDEGGAFHPAEEAADLLGVPADVVYKTLVVLREAPGRAKPLLVMIPARCQVNLKRLARTLGEKKLRMATQREAEARTGLRVGGISALAVEPGRFDIFLDASAGSLERIHVSAGVRGVDVELAVADLLTVTGARLVGAVAVEAS